jgi:2-polyprenyl-3-methyl-5-hydroxy-6-metoxy-1,4-benzoquinol methylase
MVSAARPVRQQHCLLDASARTATGTGRRAHGRTTTMHVRSAGAARRCEICGGDAFAPRFAKHGHAYVRCRTCGLERIDPQPSDAELAEIYGQTYYDAWGLQADEQHAAVLKRETFRRVIAAAGRLPPRAKVLDCGAATGFLMQVAAEASYEPYGVELSSYGARAIAQRFGADRVFEGHLEQAQFPHLQPRPSFAAAFMCDYLEHVRDPRAVLRRAAALLEPDAPLVISTPRSGSLTHRLMGRGWTHYKTEHLYYFTPSNLQALLAETGFDRIRQGAAWKTMTLEYARHQFAAYHHPVLTPLARLVQWLPAAARHRRLAIVLGEMLVVARRNHR